MMVRISTEGQYRLRSQALDRIKDLDEEMVQAVAADDEDQFRRELEELISTVRSEGQPLDAEEIVESDMVVPPPDTTLEDARRLFSVRTKG